MAFLQWRRFNFFDREAVVEPDEGTALQTLKNLDISCSAFGRGQLVFGDHSGSLYFLSRHFELSSFKAYGIRVTHLHQARQHGILVSIGEDETGVNPLIKVWNLDKCDRDGNPTCSRIVRAQCGGQQPSPVTALSVHENLNLMAIGFASGSIVLFKGDVTRERHSKQKVIYEGRQPITGLAFKMSSKNTVLFATTKAEVMSFSILAKEKSRKTALDQHGCPAHCSVLTDITQDNQFVIGSEEAVYFYQQDGRGPCLAFDGTKLQLHWFRGYLVIVGKDTQSLPRVAAGTGSSPSLEMNMITVYNIQNKFVAYSAPIPEVINVFCEWGSLYVLSADGKLYHLQEKDTQTKLEILFKKNLYDLAIKLAQSQQYDQDGIIEIFRQYGDHLYSKGDHDRAIEQYIKTIGKLEASYVIRKFLDAQRIHNLTKYLQALHKAGLATEDHTTLLLNCYTKLKDVSMLDEFIMVRRILADYYHFVIILLIALQDQEVDFDVETAIRVCRSAGYFSHALRLAEKHQQHDSYLKVQLENIKDYVGALVYIGQLDFKEAEVVVKKYGKILITNAPEQSTKLLKRLCTDYQSAGKTNKIQRANASEFIHIFVDNSEMLIDFLEHMIKVQPGSSQIMYNTLLELYLQRYSHQTDGASKTDEERRCLEFLQGSPNGYDLDQALVMCQMHSFKAGVLFLYERAKLYQQILNYHIEHDDHQHIIETCKKFGTVDPQLWVQALSYFAGKEQNSKHYITEVLSHIEKQNLLPPLLVVQTLAHNSTATLGIIREYIIRRLQQETDQISEDERLIQQYEEDTQKMKSHIKNLQTSATIFQVSKCSVCSHPLELPSVHFLCQHSFHQHCFESYSESDAECPVCLSENRKVFDILRAQEQSRDLHDQFQTQLDRSQDGFSVIADYFGRNLFNKLTLITDSPQRPNPAPAPVRAKRPPSTTEPSPTPLPSEVKPIRASPLPRHQPSPSAPRKKVEMKPAPQKPQIPEKKTEAAGNPFEEDLGPNNPFGETSKNPFDEHDDYPVEANPFGE
ncbi:hypothetical protein CAPTEDRAFT_218778 [Capitella teleta]|uniref:Vacuolar protein sorting-associated protein 11 homolog n=1 Tax=Capitella teleta TaxID=283909 RepID=R7T5T9_CAPTE|nr:hypothetical protein CAPTEDRAFT_218778 [Capitella teleta]|eukprot:ELT88573.1 hypothetical protein CAPTEDRAFT_218778 [Capitella teleta]